MNKEDMNKKIFNWYNTKILITNIIQYFLYRKNFITSINAET